MNFPNSGANEWILQEQKENRAFSPVRKNVILLQLDLGSSLSWVKALKKYPNASPIKWTVVGSLLAMLSFPII